MTDHDFWALVYGTSRAVPGLVVAIVAVRGAIRWESVGLWFVAALAGLQIVGGGIQAFSLWEQVVDAVGPLMLQYAFLGMILLDAVLFITAAVLLNRDFRRRNPVAEAAYRVTPEWPPGPGSPPAGGRP